MNTATVLAEVKQALKEGDIGGAVAFLDTLDQAGQAVVLAALTYTQRDKITDWRKN